MKNLYIYITQHIHPGSIVVAVAFDLLWSVFEGGATASILGIILLPVMIVMIFAASFGAVTLIQRFGAGDEWSSALMKGLVLGVLAAIPFSAVGMIGAVGLGLLRLVYGVDEEVILLGKLTRSWREIELTLRRLAPADVRGRSLDEVINALHSQGTISTVLKDHLHDLRRQRNTITHETSTSDLARLVKDVQSMEHTLRTRVLG